MQQTLTLLAGDSKGKENKGRGWETKGWGKRWGAEGEIAPSIFLTSHERRASMLTVDHSYASLALCGPVWLLQGVPGRLIGCGFPKSLPYLLHLGTGFILAQEKKSLKKLLVFNNEQLHKIYAQQFWSATRRGVSKGLLLSYYRKHSSAAKSESSSSCSCYKIQSLHCLLGALLILRRPQWEGGGP